MDRAKASQAYYTQAYEQQSSFASTCIKVLVFKCTEIEEEVSYKITKDDRLIIASFKLPIEVYKDDKDKWRMRDSPVS